MSSTGKTLALVVGGLAVAVGVGALIYVGHKKSMQHEAEAAFPLPNRGRQRYPARVAQDLYVKLRADGLDDREAEDTTAYALLHFDSDMRSLGRDGHSPESTSSYLYSLLVVDGSIDGDRSAAIKELHREHYEELPRRGRKRTRAA
jgi:hypothetical protein